MDFDKIYYVEYKGTDNETYITFLEYEDAVEFSRKVNGKITAIESGAVFLKKGFIQQ